ncbi:MAG TPA: hypothetical protein VK638_26100 [Edaphobacter sp.]|nr:hypothetical protein [Edaphobacter sp.]
MDKCKLAVCNRAILTLLLTAGNLLIGQSTNHENLTKLLKVETEAYSLLTYSQHYLDHDNQPVEYAGTLYLQIESFVLNDCELKLNVVVQDKYSGTEQQQKHINQAKLSIGQKSFTDRYVYQLNLKDLEIHLDSVFARPAQLRNNTGFVCQEDKYCRLQWLHIRTAAPKIRETRISNGFVDFDQPVNEITIPVTSHEVAMQSAKAFESVAASCHQR